MEENAAPATEVSTREARTESVQPIYRGLAEDGAAGDKSLKERLGETTRRARRYFQSARAPATVRAYASDLADFETWCKIEAGGLQAMPASPETVALYIADAAGRGLKASTISRRLTAISVLHKAAGLGSPALDERVKDVFKGIKREHGSLEKGAAPLLTPTIKRMIVVAHESAESAAQEKAACRDAALLLVGYAGAFRRSELSSLRVEDVEFVEDGATVLLRRSKTDQEGKGDKRALPYGSHPQTCPVRNLRRWLEVLSEAEGPVFRPIDRHGNLGEAALSDRSVCEVVKRRAQAAGLSRERYSGHSLRAGLATAASAAGVSQRSIMDQGDWKSVQTVMRYVREGTLFKNNAAASIGL
jgi:site-specific recombinase XerD